MSIAVSKESIMYRQAITVKYMPPLDSKQERYRSVRYRAICQAKEFSYSEVPSLSPDENAANAARQLAHSLGWRGAWTGGIAKDGTWIFVLIEHQNTFRIV